jgi:hypothetical protein
MMSVVAQQGAWASSTKGRNRRCARSALIVPRLSDTVLSRLVEVLGRSVIEAGGCIDIHTDRAVGPAARPCALGPLVA